jgi:hypothetical protein
MPATLELNPAAALDTDLSENALAFLAELTGAAVTTLPLAEDEDVDDDEDWLDEDEDDDDFEDEDEFDDADDEDDFDDDDDDFDDEDDDEEL